MMPDENLLRTRACELEFCSSRCLTRIVTRTRACERELCSTHGVWRKPSLRARACKLGPPFGPAPATIGDEDAQELFAMPTRINMRQNCAAQQLKKSRRYLSSISFKQVIITLRFAQRGMNIA